MTTVTLEKMKREAEKGGFVLLPISAYRKLVEAREDETDARELMKLRKEQKGKKWVEWKR